MDRLPNQRIADKQPTDQRNVDHDHPNSDDRSAVPKSPAPAVPKMTVQTSVSVPAGSSTGQFMKNAWQPSKRSSDEFPSGEPQVNELREPRAVTRNQRSVANAQEPGGSQPSVEKALLTTAKEAAAQFDSGLAYEKGRGVKKSLRRAIALYKSAADRGNTEAQFRLGKIFYEGRGVEKDFAQAASYFEMAADQGSDLAQSYLGVMYYRGQGVAQDMEKALKWFESAARQGNATAQRSLGSIYERGKGVTQDLEKAARFYQDAADSGNDSAQLRLGVMYEEGRGLEKDSRKAFRLYQKSAARGNAAAQFHLGTMYERGRGVKKNLEEAFSLYEKSADQGNASAQYSLGLMCEEGRGTEKNMQKAMMFYRKAAERGDASAQFKLGVSFYLKKNNDSDLQKARAWYEMAAKQGHATAQYNLGVMYLLGEGVTADPDVAAAWFSKAAAQGQKMAQENLSALYENNTVSGEGERLVLATYWKMMSGLQQDKKSIICSNVSPGLIHHLPEVLEKYPEFREVRALELKALALDPDMDSALVGFIEANTAIESLTISDVKVDQNYLREWNDRDNGWSTGTTPLGSLVEDLEEALLEENTRLTTLSFVADGEVDKDLEEQLFWPLSRNRDIARLRQYLQSYPVNHSSTLPPEVLMLAADQLIVQSIKLLNEPFDSAKTTLDEFLLINSVGGDLLQEGPHPG